MPKKNATGGNALFSDWDLKNLIIPLFMEQLLISLVGMSDIFIVGFTGEANVSGVSLVNAFNTIFINLFTALAAGGAVVISQYIGRRENDRAGEAASQLFLSSVLFSAMITAVVLLVNESLMRLMFGQVEDDVMEACVTYLRISAYSYPALAVYNAGAALYRSFGKTGTTMNISIAANVINIVGNCIGVFVLHAGVAGVAWPSLVSRAFTAVVITVLCFSETNPVRYGLHYIFRIEKDLQYRILRIAIPNGLESGVFQLVKVALSSVAALFGTYQIAANGVAQSIWSVAALVCVTMGPVFITVIGQCMGSGDIPAAEYYFKRLMKITLIFACVWNGLIFAAVPFVMRLYTLADETKRLVVLLVLIHNVFSALVFPFADPLGKGLRATGDVAFTTVISLFTTIGIRLVFSVIFGIWMKLGVLGIACAMCLDWTVRGIIFQLRFKGGTWKCFKVI
ncbi:MAG: MATE family efflux transporter [Eubacteriales bacterium]|nr:MATE family efflux transporter [Eubacteriales bacterium]